MPRLPYLFHASGTGIESKWQKAIRLVRYGCANRPFYHVILTDLKRDQSLPPIEQLGTFDPCINAYNEKLVALDYERILHHVGKGAIVSRQVRQILGLSGFFPIHPRSYIRAWRMRRKRETEQLPNAEKQEESIQLENKNLL